MSQITIIKHDDGKIGGFTEADQRAYAKYRAKIAELEVGELFTYSVWFPRNPKLHKLHFAVIKAVFDAQEQFSDPSELRKWLYVGAGYCDVLPGPKGRMVAVPKSIAYDKIDDAEFSDLHRKVVDFLREFHALQFLWGHLTPEQRSEMIETLLTEFERQL